MWPFQGRAHISEGRGPAVHSHVIQPFVEGRRLGATLLARSGGGGGASGDLLHT